MKKTPLLLLLSAIALTGCDFISVSDVAKNTDSQTTENTQNTQNNAGNTGENNENTSTNTGTNTDTNTGTNTGTDSGSNTNVDSGSNTDVEVHVNNKIDPKDIVPQNNPYSLNEWTNFTWHDGGEPDYPDYWQFYYGTSKNPNGCLWTNPNEKANYSGVELKENSFIASPALASWLKVEIRFTFWFSAHSSSNYQAAKNKPQFVLEAYNDQGTLLSSQDIEISRDDVPKNNTAKTITKYIREESMSFFILRFNNFIPNGNTGYTAILCDAALKGWPYNS